VHFSDVRWIDRRVHSVRFRVEHIEGELAVAGRPVSTHCPVLILVFSGCFFMAGLMLTILSYRPGTSSFNSYLRHLSGSHIAGPALLVIGLILLAAGLALQMVAQRLKQINHNEEGEQRTRQLFQLPNRLIADAPTLVVDVDEIGIWRAGMEQVDGSVLVSLPHRPSPTSTSVATSPLAVLIDDYRPAPWLALQSIWITEW
jgi:hypothetical protein